MKKYIIISNGKEYVFISKRKADAFFIDEFLSGNSVYEKK